MFFVCGQQSKINKWLSKLAIDLGASDTVFHPDVAKYYPLIPMCKSEAGAIYTTASGEPIPNLGKKDAMLVLPSQARKGGFAGNKDIHFHPKASSRCFIIRVRSNLSLFGVSLLSNAHEEKRQKTP